jgi:hypothetical protein
MANQCASPQADAAPFDAPAIDAAPDGPETLDPYAQVILADHPIAYWRLDETSGNIAYDSSGHGHDATLVGGVTLGVPGALVGTPNTAVALDGTSGFIRVGDTLRFPGTVPFAIECWVRPIALDTTSRGLVTKETTSGPGAQGYSLSLTSTAIAFARELDGTSDLLGRPLVLTSGSYYYLYAAYDGQTMLLIQNTSYLGNVPTASRELLDIADVLVLGARMGGQSGLFWGSIDEVAIYPGRLADSQPAIHYYAGLGQVPP